MAEKAGYDPHEFRVLSQPMTNLEAFISLLKCAIGTGCLAMPEAFKNAGYVVGIIATTIIGTIVVYALHLLLHGMIEMCRRHEVPVLTCAESMRLALLDGPPTMQWFSNAAGVLVDGFLALYHFGICSVYVVFIANSLKQVLDIYTIEIDARIYMLMLILPLLLIYAIRDLKHLVPFCALANLLLFVGYGVVLYYVFSDLPPITERVMVQSFERYPIFFGTVLFALESPGVIIAIEANMEKPKDYLGLLGILNRGMLVVIVLYMMFGFFGYWRYGDDIKSSITMNLPTEEEFPQMIQVCIAIAIFLSYALQGYVSVDIIWNHYMAKNFAEENQFKLELVLRAILVLLTVICGITVPKLGLILSLVGAFCLSTVGLIFPALLDMCVKYNEGYGTLNIYLIQDILLMLFGFVGGFLGTCTSILDIIESYKPESEPE